MGQKGVVRERAIDKAHIEAKEVLKKCATKNGFYASYPGYKGIWSRDSNIISLGASLLGNEFQKTFSDSLKTLENHKSSKGQIPNAVLFSGSNSNAKVSQVDYKSIDSSLWFIIGNYYYKERFGKFPCDKKEIEKVYLWLSYQDMGNDLMLEQLPTTDWQDAFPHRYGHTINTQALWYKALRLLEKNHEAEKLKEIVNRNKEDGLWSGEKGYYLPWRWKNHGKYHEKGGWFDSLGNLLAVIYDLADKSRSEKILKYIKEKSVDHPYPMKSIHPPLKKGTKDWQEYFEDCESKTPYHYSNAGIWTYIGGFYVCALVKLGKYSEAEKQLEKLAVANLQRPYFNEWLNGQSGKPGNSASGSNGNQGWNAGMYIAAYESVKRKKCVI